MYGQIKGRPPLTAEELKPGGITEMDPSELHPIAGVRVVIVRTDGTEYETATDSHGEYEFSSLPRILTNEYL